MKLKLPYLVFTATLFLLVQAGFSLFAQEAIIRPRWMGGSTELDHPGNYGIKGVSDPQNLPASRSGAMTWTDQSGNLWLFGGEGIDYRGNTDVMNDIWKYDTSTNRWTWVAGRDTAGIIPGVFKTEDMEFADTYPGSRKDAVTWQGKDGLLWMYGGFGYDSTGRKQPLADLWSFNPETERWTWEDGLPSYIFVGGGSIGGNPGQEAESIRPGALEGGVGWTTPDGKLWLFGGQGYARMDNTWNDEYLSDLWYFNPDTGNWALMNGDRWGNNRASYGTRGVADANNRPGSRLHGASWLGPDGNLWLLGGYGYDNVNLGYLNDLWKYDISTDEWTWISGDSIINQLAVRSGGTETANPGAAAERTYWTSPDGEFYILGGYGYPSVSGIRELSGIWKYDIYDNSWLYLTRNDIGIRAEGEYYSGFGDNVGTGVLRNGFAWVDGDGFTWIMGGIGEEFNAAFAFRGKKNDLYQFTRTVEVLEFNGFNDRAYVRDAEELSVQGNPAITLEAWVQISDTSNGLDQSLFNRGGMGFGYGLHLESRSSGNSLIFSHFGASSSFTGHRWENLRLNNWYHIAATYDGANARIYIDGELVADSIRTGTMSNPAFDFNELYLGYDPLLDGAWFGGSLAGVRIWSKALDQSEIERTMNLGTSGKEPGLQGSWLSLNPTKDSFIDQTNSGNNLLNQGADFPFGSIFPAPKTKIYGSEGWRLLGAPGRGVAYRDLLRDIFTQGYEGSDAGTGFESNVYFYNEETKSWGVPSDAVATVGQDFGTTEPGKGILVYVFADDNGDGIDDPFPKEISTGFYIRSILPVQLPLSYTPSGVHADDGWNLVANPFPVSISWREVVSAGGNQGTLAYAYVWDHSLNNGQGGYRIHYGFPAPPAYPGNESFNGVIPAFQAFWVKAEEEGAYLRIHADQQAPNRDLYKLPVKERPFIKLELDGEGFTDETSIIFSDEEETIGASVPKLNSLSATHAELFTVDERAARYVVNHLALEQYDGDLSIPVHSDITKAGSYEVSWDLSSLPEEWKVELHDAETGETLDMRIHDAVAIQIPDSQQKRTAGMVLPNSPGSSVRNKEHSQQRFTIRMSNVQLTGTQEVNDLPKEMILHQNYPNPFNPSTTIRFELTEMTDVRLAVYDMLGREVAVLLNESRPAGSHDVSFNASELSSGMYFYRLKAGSNVFIQKMTLLK